MKTFFKSLGKAAVIGFVVGMGAYAIAGVVMAVDIHKEAKGLKCHKEVAHSRMQQVTTVAFTCYPESTDYTEINNATKFMFYSFGRFSFDKLVTTNLRDAVYTFKNLSL